MYYTFCHTIGVDYTEEQTSKLALWMRQSEHLHAWFPYKGVVLVSERPTTLHVDDRGRLHSLTGAALAYADGYGLYAVHGVRVSPDIINTPDTITPKRIEEETNAEIRRIMILIYGFDRYLRDGGFVLEQTDKFGSLFRKKIAGEPDMVFVHVINSTPEPDGTRKEYTIPCRATVTSAHEAVAASFGLTVDQYKPILET